MTVVAVEECFVGAAFYDFPFINDDDTIGITDCGEAVGDDENGAAFANGSHVLHDGMF